MKSRTSHSLLAALSAVTAVSLAACGHTREKAKIALPGNEDAVNTAVKSNFPGFEFGTSSKASKINAAFSDRLEGSSAWVVPGKNLAGVPADQVEVKVALKDMSGAERTLDFSELNGVLENNKVQTLNADAKNAGFYKIEAICSADACKVLMIHITEMSGGVLVPAPPAGQPALPPIATGEAIVIFKNAPAQIQANVTGKNNVVVENNINTAADPNIDAASELDSAEIQPYWTSPGSKSTSVSDVNHIKFSVADKGRSSVSPDGSAAPAPTTAAPSVAAPAAPVQAPAAAAPVVNANSASNPALKTVAAAPAPSTVCPANPKCDGSESPDDVCCQ